MSPLFPEVGGVGVTIDCCIKMEGKIKYFHSKTFLRLTDTVKSKINIWERKIENDHDTELCYSKTNQNEIYKMIII